MANDAAIRIAVGAEAITHLPRAFSRDLTHVPSDGLTGNTRICAAATALNTGEGRVNRHLAGHGHTRRRRATRITKAHRHGNWITCHHLRGGDQLQPAQGR